MKFGADGNMFTPKLTYAVNWATNRKTGALELDQAWAKYQFADDWAAMGGQFKDPTSHESLVGWDRQLAAERSFPNVYFTGGDDYVQGVALIYTHAAWRITGATTDGSNRFNDNFQDYPTNSSNFGFAARAEYKVFGDWNDYSDFNPINLKHDLFVVGAGADYTQSGDTGIFLHTVDGQYTLTNGWTFYGAYMARSYQNAPILTGTGAPVTDTFDGYDWSIEAEAGYKIDQHWEPFARYTFTNFDEKTFGPAAENEVSEITAGINYFWYGEAAKFTLDFTWMPNGSPATIDGAGILANDGGNEFIVRAQFQLLI